MQQHTAAAHAVLETAPLMRAFASPTPLVGEYPDYLARQLRLHAPLEDALRQWVPQEWVELRLMKSLWLLGDLRALGAEAEHRTTEIPTPGSEAEALGILYVLEGATLGLQVVRRRLHRDHPALHAAGRFMHGYGPQTGHHWRAFLDRLETLPDAQWPEAMDAARATFAAFQRVFLEAGRPGQG
jgi:heme oxygenase